MQELESISVQKPEDSSQRPVLTADHGRQMV